MVLKRLFFALAEPKKYLVLTMPPELLNQEKRSCDVRGGGRAAPYLKIRVRTAHGYIHCSRPRIQKYIIGAVRHEGVCVTIKGFQNLMTSIPIYCVGLNKKREVNVFSHWYPII